MMRFVNVSSKMSPRASTTRERAVVIGLDTTTRLRVVLIFQIDIPLTASIERPAQSVALISLAH